jgi:cell division protein FtsI (penicillin-binding protein 3)
MRHALVTVTEPGGTGTLAAIPGISVAGKTGTAQKYEQTFGYERHKYFSSFIGFLPADRPELVVGVMVDEPRWPFYGGQVAAPLFKRIATRALQILDRMPKGALTRAETKLLPPGVTFAPSEMKSVGAHAVMPDLKGVAARDAIRVLGSYADRIKLSGSGYVDGQTPHAGTLLSAG